ncbi:MAG: OmpA family protein [Pseudomonadales bacterium]|jgi:peptidoglycan-associated lipoprotein|nr:OmpA family protein [Pseudomonadales bacterium]
MMKTLLASIACHASTRRTLAMLPLLFALGACTTTYSWREVPGPILATPRAQPVPATPNAPQQNGPGSAADFIAYAGDRVFFDFDKAVIKPEARAILDKQAEWLNRYSGVTVRIEGNTDEIGTREYNLALGERRANAVRAYLMSHGIAQARFYIVSYGEERPLEQPGSAARNRNARTVVIATGGQ